MGRKILSIKQLLLFLGLFQIVILSGCTYLTNDGEVENVNVNGDYFQRNELEEKISTLNPYIEDLDGMPIEDLREIYEELKINQEQRINDCLKKIDEDQQLDEEDMKHHHDPNPPQPPIYEKPEPVPDPPIEEN